jgi:hypothetical protein
MKNHPILSSITSRCNSLSLEQNNNIKIDGLIECCEKDETLKTIISNLDEKLNIHVQGRESNASASELEE